MATSSVSAICSTCNEEEAITYICTGCSKHFCFNDLVEHRESLKPQFYEIQDQRNEFIQMLNDQNSTNNHPLIYQINQWEQTSIDKIRQTANEQRQLIQQSIHENTEKIQTKLNTLTEEMQKISKRQDFNESMLNKLRTRLEDLKQQLHQPNTIKIREDSSSSYINKLSITINSTTDQCNFYHQPLKSNIKWKQNAQTVAGGNGEGNRLNQFDHPTGIYIDSQQRSIYIADHYNHRIVKWKLGENNGQTVAGGNGQGNRIDQLNQPTDMIVDENNKCLIICDAENRRVVRWSLENQQDIQIIIGDIKCWGLMVNRNGDLFVSDEQRHEVKRWRKGEKEGTIVAGGNGNGDQLNQLNQPTYIFIDRQETVYVSDRLNHRVMKWVKGAREGTIVAGGQGQGSSLKQLSYPNGLIVNEVGDIYVADCDNDRIVCWSPQARKGRVVLGGNGLGKGLNQFYGLRGLALDVDNNLYVTDFGNNRIQRFEVDQN